MLVPLWLSICCKLYLLFCGRWTWQLSFAQLGHCWHEDLKRFIYNSRNNVCLCECMCMRVPKMALDPLTIEVRCCELWDVLGTKLQSRTSAATILNSSAISPVPPSFKSRVLFLWPKLILNSWQSFCIILLSTRTIEAISLLRRRFLPGPVPYLPRSQGRCQLWTCSVLHGLLITVVAPWLFL